MSDEAKITINGVDLTSAQAMTFRVAITCYFAEMFEEGALGDDEHGESMRKAYYARAAEIIQIMGAAE
jgi:hypothetical protein